MDVMGGVDDAVEDRLGHDGVREQPVPVLGHPVGRKDRRLAGYRGYLRLGDCAEPGRHFLGKELPRKRKQPRDTVCPSSSTTTNRTRVSPHSAGLARW